MTNRQSPDRGHSSQRHPISLRGSLPSSQNTGGLSHATSEVQVDAGHSVRQHSPGRYRGRDPSGQGSTIGQRAPSQSGHSGQQPPSGTPASLPSGQVGVTGQVTSLQSVIHSGQHMPGCVMGGSPLAQLSGGQRSVLQFPQMNWGQGSRAQKMGWGMHSVPI